jgi:membrane-associated phospholipid phosphatase
VAATPPPTDPASRRSLRRRLAGGPIARRLAAADLAVYRVVRGDLHSARLTPAIRAFSATGEHAALWLAFGAAGAALDRPRRRRWLRATAVVGTTQALNVAVKVVVRRHRPVIEDLPALIATPTQLSFPSAHSSSSFAAAGAFGDLVPRAPLLAVAGAMALSRVYLGVHYPTDIAAGALLGTGVAAILRRP